MHQSLIKAILFKNIFFSPCLMFILFTTHYSWSELFVRIWNMGFFCSASAPHCFQCFDFPPLHVSSFAICVPLCLLLLFLSALLRPTYHPAAPLQLLSKYNVIVFLFLSDQYYPKDCLNKIVV
ncbi:Serine/threonine-protein kinase SRK2H [Frankliniella fusca]|uniref:Serine/threonine-protein kinase SRK2H n=1 Tax=Frankliniella fusca TaxID=407009 RepID=A0AAE1HMB2_9NEOP|nr:Serine/threonine-protein kinase SRK2H [Frankliniella fusca]